MTKKRNKMKVKVLLFFILSITACATTSREGQIQKGHNISREYFSKTATVKDDSLETVVTITTFEGLPGKKNALGQIVEDNFLRAFIDKKTREIRYQVYQMITYQGSQWKYFQIVNYETPSGPESTSLTVIDNKILYQRLEFNIGVYSEVVGFSVEENLLRNLAARYSPQQGLVWKFKFKSKSGEEHNDSILLAEIAGLLDKVDEYTGRKTNPPKR